MACLVIFIAMLSYICGRLHAWYKHSLIALATSHSVIGTEHSQNPAVFRPRAVYVRRIRTYLKPGHILQKRGSETVVTEPACREQKEHENAIAEAKVKIEAIKDAAEQYKLPLGESLYLAFTTEKLENVVKKQQAEIDTLKAAKALSHPVILATPPHDVKAEQEVTELKTRLASSGEEIKKAKRQYRQLEDLITRTKKELELIEVRAEKAETLEQKVFSVQAELTNQRTAAKHERRGLTEAQTKIRRLNKELSEATEGMTKMQDEMKELKDTCDGEVVAAQLAEDLMSTKSDDYKEKLRVSEAECQKLQSNLHALQTKLDHTSALSGEPHVCDHRPCLAAIQEGLAALQEGKDLEIAELRITNDTEMRALKRSLEVSTINFNTKSFKVSLLEGDLADARHRCKSTEIENVNLRTAGQQIEVDKAELKLRISTMQKEVAAEKAKCKQLESLRSLEHTTSAPSTADFGRSDDAPIPFENLPLSWPRPSVAEPEPTKAAKIAARVRAPMRSQTQVAGVDGNGAVAKPTEPADDASTPSSSSPPSLSDGSRESSKSSSSTTELCQPGRKHMDKLNEDDFGMRMRKYADHATGLHQKWNRANMTSAAGSGDVVKNFQEILRNWDYVKPEMLKESKLEQAVMKMVGTEGKWQGAPSAAISSGRRPPHALMVKLGKDIQLKVAGMGQDHESKGGKRSRA